MFATTILLFCFCTGLATSEVYYIRTSSENSSCAESFCLTLSNFAANFKNSSYKTNTLFFQQGNHSLGSTLTVKYGNNFSMIVLNHSRVTVSCEWDTKFQFFLTSNVYISGLVITHCENSHQIRGVNKFMLINCIISYHEYTAMYFSYSNVNITNTSFISNWGGSSQKISKLLSYSYALVGAAVVFSACNATISRCVFEDNRAETGAAVFSTWETKITIITCIFVENQADGQFSYGGAIYFEDECVVILLNSTFQDNSAAGFGGAVQVVSQSSLFTQFSNFIANQANTGGAINAYEANQITINNCSFTENTANDSGGVLFAFQVNRVNILSSRFESNGANRIAGVIEAFLSPIEVRGSEFKNNNATKYGGVFVIVYAHITVDSTKLIRNSARYAGVMYINAQAYSEFSNCEFLHNSASIQGGIIITHFADMKFVDCMFAGNRAFSGATLHIQSNSVVQIENVTIRNNTAEQGIWYCIESTTIFLNNVHVLDNHGSLFSHYSKVLFRGNISIVNNEPTRHTGTTSIFQEGGAITAFQSEINLMGNSTFVYNTAINGGAISLIASKIYMSGSTLIINNTATDSGGGMYIFQSEVSFKEHSSLQLIGNSAAERGGGIHATSSIITLIYDIGTGSGRLYTGTILKFIDNTAEKAGGGMSLEVNSKLTNLNSRITANPINTLFTRNIAYNKGSSVYGGLLDRCSVSPFVQRANNELEKAVDGVSYFKSVSNNTDPQPYAISSNPVKVCFCQDNLPNCNVGQPPPMIKAKKGYNFTVPLVAVDQVQNVVSAAIFSSPRSNESGIGEGQHIQSTGENCTDLIFSVSSPSDHEELLVYADGPCKRMLPYHKV